MKNKIYIAGLLSSIMIISGSMLKILHIAGAGICLFIGIVFLCLVFLPAAVISCYKDNMKQKPLLYIAIFLTIFIDFTGGLFKIMHWPGAGLLKYFGILSPILIFLPVYLYYHYREQEESNINFLYVMFLMAYLSVMSALLALNVSKNVIGDVIYSEKINNLNNYHNLKDQTTIDSQVINELKFKTNELVTLIQDTKIKLILHGNKANKSAIMDNKQIDLFKITNKDSKDAPGTILFGKEKALEINNKLEEYQYFAKELSLKTKTKPALSSLILLSYKTSLDDPNWIKEQFDDKPLVFALQTLTNIENAIIIIESELMAKIKAESLKEEI